MKRVVSISLGSSRRNKKVTARLFDTDFEIERIGTDGDMAKYRQLVADYDGKVDAFGVGGCDIYLYAGDKRYTFREPKALWVDAKITPYVDGSGLKNTLEREAVITLQDHGIVDFTTKAVLMIGAVDRFGMAEALSERAKSIVFGDLMFGLGIPIPIRSLAAVKRLARALLPIIVQLPFKWIYPTGEKQNHNTPKYTPFFAEADVIAGDFLLISRFMPEDMRGKIVLTNTTTEADVVELKRRGVHQLITTTPVIDGRSFGTNVMEAALVSLLEKSPEQIAYEAEVRSQGKKPGEVVADTLLGAPIAPVVAPDYLDQLHSLGWKPQVQELNPAATDPAVSRIPG